MIKFRVFGSLDLRGPKGEEILSVLSQPKRIALLAYLTLATPRGFHRRDKLLGLFWPEADQSHARNSLSQALRFLRRSLGEELILTRGADEVGLDFDRIQVDALSFEADFRASDLEGAMELYRGHLLEGFFLSDCPEFERWLDEERVRLREVAAVAAWELAHRRISAGFLTDAETIGQRALSLVTTNETEMRRFVKALDEAGDRAAAVRFYERFAQGLEDQLGLKPSAESWAVVEGIRASGEAAASPPIPSAPPSHDRERDLEAAPIKPTSAPPSLGRGFRERRVVLWGIASLAGAWGLVEAARFATGQFHWPEAVPQGVMLVAALGFFVAVILAWYHGQKGRQRISGPDLLMVSALLVVAAGVLSLLLSGERAGGDPGTTAGRFGTLGPEPVLPMSTTRVAVFPPTVIGADSARQYSEWMSDALYRLLDGLGDLEGSDPNALYSAVQRSGYAVLGTEEGRSLAEYLGAGMFVLSRLSDVGGRVSVSSTLYHTEDVQGSVREAFGEGRWEEIGTIAETLTRELFAGHLEEEDYRLLGTAQIPTVSFEALRAYLEGEQLFRQRSVNGAMEAFDRAIAADSTFSLAWFGRAMLRGQYGHSLESIDAALGHTAGLARRDSLLLEAARARYVDTDLADELTRTFVAQFPGYTWGWHVRGLHLLWFTWRWGRSVSEARGPYERLLELEPDHPFGLFFLRWVANFEEQSQERDSLLALYLRGTPDEDWELYFEGERALEGAEGTRRDSVFLGMESYPDDVIAGLSLEDWRRADVAVLLTDSMTRPELTRVDGFQILAFSEAGRGRWRSASDHLDRLALLDPGSAIAYRGLLAAMPYLDLPDSTVERIRREVMAWDGRRRIELETRSGGTLSFWAFPGILGPHLKTYLLGLLAGRLGDTDELRLRATVLQDSVESTPCNHLGPDLALEFQALAALAESKPAEALTLLQRAQLDVCHPVDQNIPLNMRPFGRLLRGECLADLGQEEEALGWFEGFAPLWGTEEILYKPYLYLRCAQLEEHLGQLDQARAHYEMFIEAWEGADPHLQHLVNLARERVKALQ